MRDALNRIETKPAAIGLIILVVVVFVITWGTSDDARSLSSDVNEQAWIDVDGNVFAHQLVPFSDAPVTGPTGKPAFRAELCFWTTDGKTKSKSTPVLLNTHLGKAEPTFCPDCTRLVLPLNPPPPDLSEGVTEHRAPPTQAEYNAKRRN